MSAAAPSPRRPTIAIDGTESAEGRALFAVSSLYWCTDWLSRVNLRMIDVLDENVALAIELLHWEIGVTVEMVPPTHGMSPLEGADVYAAVAFRSAHHLRLAEARRGGIPAFVALQFPDPSWLSPSVLLRQAAAFDPQLFAHELHQIVHPWL